MDLPLPDDSLPSGPRERLLGLGPDSLADADLLAVLLGTGLVGEPVTVLAARLLDKHGSLAGLARLGTAGLAAERGVGPVKAARIVAGLELGRRSVARPLPRGRRIVSSRDVDDALRPRLAPLEVEHFVAIALDTRNRALAELRLGQGGAATCGVAPSDVFRALLREGATGVVFAHNHPSGDPTPSEEDVRFTERLLRAGELLGIRVLDHVIIARDGYTSFLDGGLLPRAEARP